MSADDDLRRASHAQALLDDPLINDTLTTIRADIITQWAKSKPEEADRRESLWAELRAIERFEGTFRSHINTGKLAKNRS